MRRLTSRTIKNSSKGLPSGYLLFPSFCYLIDRAMISFSLVVYIHVVYFGIWSKQGWKNEKVVARFCDNDDRVVLLDESDLSGHKQKV